MTSELRELVWVPIASSASSTTTSCPASASSRATARPTTPAPTTSASSRSTPPEPFADDRAEAGERRDARHRARAAVESRGEERAHAGGYGEADRADQRGGRAGGVRKGSQRERGRARHDHRGPEQHDAERQDGAEPGDAAAPRER